MVQAGKASARSSFSTRFFAQSSHPLPVLSLFQDSPQSQSTEDDDKKSTFNEGGISTSTLLAEEREMLKLKELQDNLPTENSATQISGGFKFLGMINHDIKEHQRADERQPASITDKEQSSSISHGASIVDSDHYELNSSNEDCAVLANDALVESCLLCFGMDDKSSAVLNLESDVQEEILPIPCSEFSMKETDVVNNESPPGDGKNVCVDEGQGGGVVFVEEYKNPCSDILRDRPGGMIVKPKESLSDMKKALEDLTLALDRAILLIRELDLTHETDNATAANLSSLHEEYIPPALQKVWLLSDSMTALNPMTQETASACDHPPVLECSCTSYSEHGSLRLSNTGMSRPCTAASTAPASSAIGSIDLEGFIQNYSVRFSTTLANQVLALVQKGLSDHLDK